MSAIWQKWQRAAVFAVIGLISTAIYAILTLLGESWLEWPIPLVSALAYMAGMVWSYLGHRHFTFASRQPHGVAIPRFIQLSALGYGLSIAIPFALSVQMGLASWVSVATTCIAVPLVNAMVMSAYVFAAPLLGPSRTFER
jgi:putative flippase GtrA